MRTRLLAIGLAAISAALVACGGGGGTTGTPPTPVATATPTPTPAPTPDNAFGCVGQAPFAISRRTSSLVPRPITSGDSFAYAGSLQETYAQSSPCPEPTSTSAAAVSMQVTDSATSAPGGGSATASTSAETDAFATHTSDSSTTQLLQLSGSALLLYSTNSNDGTGNSIATAYGTPQEIDDLGAGGSWSNNPAATVAESLSDGSSIARTLASDGSYTDTQTYSNGATAVATVNGAANGKPLDGSGTYVFAGITFSYAAPAGGNIQLTISSPGNASKTRTFPAWFTKPSSSYVSDAFADNGTKPFDPSCGSVPASIGTSGTQIVETYNVLDPVLGYTETRTTTSYDVSGYGPACVTIADVVNSFYDYSDDTTRVDYQSQNGQPNSVDTIAETLSMQSAACGSGSAPCAQLRRAEDTRPVSPGAIRAAVAAIEHTRAVQRAARLQALHALARQFVQKGSLR